MTMLFDITLNDVFAKFDVNCKKELSWQEFKAFLEVIGYKMTLEEFAEVLTSEDRNRAGKSVPGWALYLWEVGYPTKGEFAMT